MVVFVLLLETLPLLLLPSLSVQVVAFLPPWDAPSFHH
jgi:hypothetical protein